MKNPTLYNQKHSFVYNFGEELIQLLNPQKNERILDLGCGSGQLTNRINLISKDVIGIDKSSEMIADAKTRFKDIDFRILDATDFHFDKGFDAIFSNAVLHWVTEPQKAIKCMFENLNLNGRIVLEFGGAGNIQIIENQLRSSLLKRGYQKQANLNLWYFPSISEYTTLLENNGFRVTMAQHFNRPTKLADKKTGIKDWLSMFGTNFFENLPQDIVDEIKNEVQELIKPKSFINNEWIADYKRIRIMALKE